MSPRPKMAPIDPKPAEVPPLCFAYATGYNREGKKDGDEFVRECRAWCDLHGGTYTIGRKRLNPAPRRKFVEFEIKSNDFQVLAVFGHGLANSYPATGHNMATIGDLVQAIHLGADLPKLDVILYSCATATGKKGFADVLSDLLTDKGYDIRVWGRTASQHTTIGPSWELAGGPSGGRPIITSADGPLWKRWRERLREDRDFRLSWWTLREIDAIRASV